MAESEAARMLRLQREHQAKQGPQRHLVRNILLGIVGVFGFVVLLGFIGEAMDPEGAAKRRAEREAEAVARASADAAEAEKSKAQAAAAKASDAKAEKAKITATVQGFSESVMGAMEPCDQAGGKIATVSRQIQAGGATVYEGFGAARETSSACLQSFSAISDLEVPADLPAAAREAAEKALSSCKDAMSMKREMGDSAQAIFDGDMRPSALSKFQEARDLADRATMLCATQVVVTAAAAGVELKTGAAAAK